MKSMTVVTGALIASLIANVYLFVTRPSGSSERVTARSSNEAQSERRGELPALSRATPADRDAADPAAREREAALTAQLLKTQAELEAQRSIDDYFRDAPDRSPEVEERARAELDKVFPTKSGQNPIYTVECHGAKCSLKFDDDQDPDVWRKALRESETGGAFPVMQFSSTGAYFQLASPDDLAGARYVQAVFGVIRNSPAVAACKQRFPIPGEVVLGVVLGASRDVHVTMQGKLADQDFGACLRPVIEQAPSQVPPPPATIQSLPGSVMVVSVARPDAPRAPDAPVERRPAREHLATKLLPLTN